MSDGSNPINYSGIKAIAEDLCGLILRYGDSLPKSEEISKFITDTSEKYNSFLNQIIDEPHLSESEIRSLINDVVDNAISLYITGFNNKSIFPDKFSGEPFEFDTGNEFDIFKRELLKEINNIGSCSKYLEKIARMVVNRIDAVSEEYRRFIQFFNLKFEMLGIANALAAFDKQANQQLHYFECKATNTINEAEKRVKRAGQKAASTAALEATKKANLLAKTAKNHADKARKDAELASEKAADAVEMNVAKLEARLSQKTAETSITVLGIFATVVITIIAGLFFSSSVLENINNASVWRLGMASSVVGLVCFNMITLMIMYLSRFTNEKISDGGKKYNNWVKVITVCLNIVLVIILIVSTVENGNEEAKTSSFSNYDDSNNISVDIHLDSEENSLNENGNIQNSSTQTTEISDNNTFTVSATNTR